MYTFRYYEDQLHNYIPIDNNTWEKCHLQVSEWYPRE